MTLPRVALESQPEQPPVSSEYWAVSIRGILLNENRRLDARHFNPTASNAVQQLRDMDLEVRPLSQLAELALPSQFARIWAKDRDHGLPYLNATDLLNLMALGVTAGSPRYLSHATETNLDELVIRKGMLLLTCSGTIGRVFYVPDRLDGWAATHDLIRIVPKEPEMAGFLYAYLSTLFAQDQILSHTHGGQIDHVTDLQVGSCLVPVPGESHIRRISTKVLDALSLRERAIETLSTAWTLA